jgi:hypothetical protein
LAKVADLCRSAIAELLRRDVAARIVEYLQSCTYEEPFAAPHELRIFRAYGVLIGGAGWRNIATVANVNDVFHHSTIWLSSGRERTRIALA